MPEKIRKKKEFGVNRSHLFKWGALNDIEFDIGIEIEAFKKYIQENEKILIKINEELLQKVEEDTTLNSRDPERLISYQQHKYGLDDKVICILIKTHRFSVLLLMIAFFEGTLKELYEEYKRKSSPAEGLKNLKEDYSFFMAMFYFLKNRLKKQSKIKQDDNLNTYWQFITKTVKVDKKYIQSHYGRIMEIKTILRNPVTHANGKIESTHVPMIKRTSGLSLTENEQYFYINDSRFLLALLGEIETFFKNLLKEIDKRIEQTKEPEPSC